MATRRTAEAARALVPDDDTLWTHRSQPWAFWRAWTGLSHHTMHRYLTRRGWKSHLGRHGGWKYAPCGLCGASFEIGPNQEERRCPEHTSQKTLAVEGATDYERELAAYMDRIRTGKVQQGRPYTTAGTSQELTMRQYTSPLVGRRQAA